MLAGRPALTPRVSSVTSQTTTMLDAMRGEPLSKTSDALLLGPVWFAV